MSGISKEVINQLKLKSEVAFNEIYTKYHKLIFYVIYEKVKNFAVTEELVQDTFLSIVNKIYQYKGGNFKFWCLQIAKNKAFDYLRKVQKEKIALTKYQQEMLQNQEKTEVDISEQEKLLLELYEEIKNIVGDDLYNIIILHVVHGMKLVEIAKVQNVTGSSVRGKYHRAMKKIKKELNYEKYKELNY